MGIGSQKSDCWSRKAWPRERPALGDQHLVWRDGDQGQLQEGPARRPAKVRMGGQSQSQAGKTSCLFVTLTRTGNTVGEPRDGKLSTLILEGEKRHLSNPGSLTLCIPHLLAVRTGNDVSLFSRKGMGYHCPQFVPFTPSPQPLTKWAFLVGTTLKSLRMCNST